MEQHIHESNLIEGFDSEEADKCLMEAWGYMRGKPSINTKRVKQIQYFATRHQNDLTKDQRGRYRTVDVWIGGRKGKDPAHLHLAMAEWLEAMRSPENVDPQAAHVWFEKIHPFVDGNGRTGRILMWWHEEKIGKEPTLITREEVGRYYDWFK